MAKIADKSEKSDDGVGPEEDGGARFEAVVHRPANGAEAGGGGQDEVWGFVRLPTAVSGALPRRGRATVEVRIAGGEVFQEVAEPDGRKGHWVRIRGPRLEAAGLGLGETASFEVRPAAEEPEPRLPADLRQMLKDDGPARATWDATTTWARVDWVHWIESAKRSATRAKRIADARQMLGEGKKRVCCFDPSGFYSKALSAPEAADD